MLENGCYLSVVDPLSSIKVEVGMLPVIFITIILLYNNFVYNYII